MYVGIMNDKEKNSFLKGLKEGISSTWKKTDSNPVFRNVFLVSLGVATYACLSNLTKSKDKENNILELTNRHRDL